MRTRQVRVPVGDRLLADVGYALTCWRLSTIAVDAGGKVKSKLDKSGASPLVEIRASSAAICLWYNETFGRRSTEAERKKRR